MSGWPVISWWLLGAAVVLLAMAVTAWRRRMIPGLWALGGLLVSCAAYEAGFACELAPAFRSHVAWCSALEYAGIVLVPPFLLCFIAGFTSRDRWLRPWVRTGLFLFAGLNLFVKLTDSWHGLVYRWVAIEPRTDWTLLHVAHGPWYWVINGYLFLSFGVTILIAAFTWPHANGLFRRQLRTIALGTVLPWLVHVWGLTGLAPWGEFDMVPFSLLITVLLTGWAVLHDNFTRLAPVARNQLFEMMNSGVLVADLERRVADINPAATRLLGVSERSACGRPLATVLAHRPELAKLGLASEEARLEVRPTTADGTDTVLEATWHPLADHAGRPRGFLLILRDVTEYKRTERQLKELLTNRTLEWRRATAAALRASEEEQDRIGRELHDTLCPELTGLVRQSGTLADQPAVPPEIRERIRGFSTQAGVAARYARDLSHLLARPDFAHAPFDDLLHAHLHHLGHTLGLSCELTIDPAFPALVPEASGHLIRIVREAVANAARHAGAKHVRVECVVRQGRPVVSISNDGRPPPPPEMLTEGLGLRQMRMRATLLDATMDLRPGAPSGAVIELTFASCVPVPTASPKP